MTDSVLKDAGVDVDSMVPESARPKPPCRHYTIPLDFINKATNVTDDEAKKVMGALQTQVDRDFGPVWGIDCQLIFVGKGVIPDPGHWWLVLLDTADQAGALGYHDLTDTGLPIGKVFVETTKADGGKWSVTSSHELMEMLVDPWINLCVLTQSFPGSGNALLLVAYEVADAPEDDKYGYEVDGVLLSDFVYPAYFEERPVSGARLDHLGHITEQFQILPNGYLSVMQVNGAQGWQQVNNRANIGMRRAYRDLPHIGSRRERRRRGLTNLMKSDVLTG